MAPPLSLRALYPHNRYLSAKVRAFVDFLAARFGQEPPWDSWRRTPIEQSALSAPHRKGDDQKLYQASSFKNLIMQFMTAPFRKGATEYKMEPATA